MSIVSTVNYNGKNPKRYSLTLSLSNKALLPSYHFGVASLIITAHPSSGKYITSEVWIVSPWSWLYYLKIWDSNKPFKSSEAQLLLWNEGVELDDL